MTDFLFELRSEEIPARMQVRAKDDLARLFADEIAKAGLTAQSIETFATPRRLALIARGLPDETVAVSEERKGPRVSAPEAALAGFLRATSLTRDQLIERDGIFYAVIEKPGRPTTEVLAQAIPAIIRAFPWPKSMRWGDASISSESLRWVRPLQGIVALFGEDIVECEIDGIQSGAATLGHRFHHPGPITIGSTDDYVEDLRLCHVIVHLSERKALIEEGAARAAAAAGLRLIPDEGLVLENAGLTEWPVPLLGRFDPAFLELPRDVIQLTMRTNQKYFALADAEEQLINAFICTANIDASDGGAAVIAGNEKVLSARLSDAKFFWEQDLKVPLEDQAKKLSQIVFHEKLGTVADKVERVAKLARWLVEEGIVKLSPSPSGEGLGVGPAGAPTAAIEKSDKPHPNPSPEGEGLATLAETAARLCKADLVTGMVGEFPELQGVMGGYYARAQGYAPEVADAIRDHYKPVGQGDDVPTAPVTVAVSLADKLDTIVSFFACNIKPTGSKDPFALRRAAIQISQTILENGLRLPLLKVIQEADRLAQDRVTSSPSFRSCAPGSKTSTMSLETLDFFADRLKVQQREAGVRHDLIDAVFALGGEDDLVRLLARVKALQSFVGTDEGKNLLAGYKRAANILKKDFPSPPAGEGDSAKAERGEGAAVETSAPAEPLTPLAAGESPSPAGGEGQNPLSYTPEIVETALIDALDAAEPLATAAIEREDFEGAMSALASLRAPIDAFFETVTVNDPDPAKRAARLALLGRVRDAVHRVADFSKIDG